MTDPGIASARLEWSTGEARLRRVRRTFGADELAAADHAGRAIGAELVRRLGPGYRLVDLYSLAIASDTWAPPVVAEYLVSPRIVAAIAPMVDAACHRLSGGARDGH